MTLKHFFYRTALDLVIIVNMGEEEEEAVVVTVEVRKSALSIV